MNMQTPNPSDLDYPALWVDMDDFYATFRERMAVADDYERLMLRKEQDALGDRLKELRREPGFMAHWLERGKLVEHCTARLIVADEAEQRRLIQLLYLVSDVSWAENRDCSALRDELRHRSDNAAVIEAHRKRLEAAKGQINW